MVRAFFLVVLCFLPLSALAQWEDKNGDKIVPLPATLEPGQSAFFDFTSSSDTPIIITKTSATVCLEPNLLGVGGTFAVSVFWCTDQTANNNWCNDLFGETLDASPITDLCAYELPKGRYFFRPAGGPGTDAPRMRVETSIR
jgi:hypothetical protein